MKKNNYSNELIMVGIPDEYVEHGNVDILKLELMEKQIK